MENKFMSSIQNGGCLCEAIRYEISGEPEYTIQCYCRDCQHISGGGSLPQYVVKRETVTMSGPLKTHQLKSDAGNNLELGFCGDCGSPIYKTTSLKSDVMFICVGSLDDPTIFSPEHKVYEASRQPWDGS